MTEEATIQTTQPVAQRALPAGYSPDREAFELELRRAKVLAASTLLPEQYRDNIPNCMIALNMAKRIGADVMQVAQNLYIVHGKPGWSGQFLIATFNQSGKFSAIRYEWQGKEGEKDWGCRAWATERATGEKVFGPWVTWKMVEAEGWSKKSGSKWLTMPSMMFSYRAAAFLVRTHAPEIAMGLQTAEEIGDTYDVTPTVNGIGDPGISGIDRVKAQVRQAIDAGTGEVIEGEKGDPPAAESENRPTMPAAAVRAQLEAANEEKSRDKLDQAAASIALVVSVKEQKELTAFYKQAIADLDE